MTAAGHKKYRLLLIPTGNRRPGDLPKEERLMNFDQAKLPRSTTRLKLQFA